MTSTNPAARGLEARRASLAPGAYLAIVHVSQGERLGPIGRGDVLPEVLDHIEAIETELAESRAALADAHDIPAHTQEFIDNVRRGLGMAASDGHTPAERVALRLAYIGAALDKFNAGLRGAR